MATIEQDPATTARLISLANSAMYRRPNPILSLQDAVIKVLGLDITRAISLGIAFSALLSNQNTTSQNQKIIWFDSMLMANCTRELARRVPSSEDSAAFAYTGALLSNLGLLALAAMHPSRVDRCIEHTVAQAPITGNSDRDEPQRRTLDESVCDEFGFDHREIAAELAHIWELPEQFTALITLKPALENSVYNKSVELAQHSRTLIDTHSKGTLDLLSDSVGNLPDEIGEAMLSLCGKFDRFVSESEIAAIAIASAS